MAEVRAALEARGCIVRFELRDGTTAAALSTAERIIGAAFPPSLRRFLLEHDGARLACGERDVIGVRYAGIAILGGDDILAYKRGEPAGSLYRNIDLFSPANRSLLQRGIPLATYDDGFNLCILDPSSNTGDEHAVVDADHETSYDWQSIAPDFDSWLDRSLKGALADGYFTYWVPGSPG